MVALVTGAGGFLGGYVCERLRAGGAQVVPAGRPEIEVPSPQLAELLERSAPDAVVHLATPASVPLSVERPDEDLAGSATALDGLLGLLGELPQPPRVVFVSSAAVYGEPARLPVAEGDATDPVSPYGRHRLLCEQRLAEYHPGSVCLRVFSAYGEGLRRQVLWEICRQAVRDGRVQLAGTGHETRDFVHAADVAGAVARVLASPEAAGPYNVAGGRATAIRDLAQALLRELGLGDEHVTFSGRARSGDPHHWQADVSRITGLGWQPEVPLAEGLARYARWARSQL